MLVFVHGLGHTPDAWQPFLQFFQERDIECRAIDLRKSHDPSQVRFRDYVDTVVSQVDEDDVVVGHSMGGLIMQKTAEETTIRGGIGICSAPPRSVKFKRRMVLSSLHYLPYVLLKKPFYFSYGYTRKWMFNCMSEERARQVYEHEIRTVPPQVAYELAMNKIPVNEAKVDCPLHFMAATEDRLSPPPLVKQIAEKYDVSHSVHGGCHYIFPNWKPYAQGIASFLDTVIGIGLYCPENI